MGWGGSGEAAVYIFEGFGDIRAPLFNGSPQGAEGRGQRRHHGSSYHSLGGLRGLPFSG